MTEKKENKAFKVLTIVLALSLIVLAVFTVKFYNEEQADKAILENEKLELEQELNDYIIRYEEALAENSEYSNDLTAAKERIVALLDSVKDMDANLALIAKFRREISNLKKEKETLFRTIDSLNQRNEMLATKIDSTTTVLTRQTFLNDSLAVQNESLASKVKKGSKLNLTNVKAEAIKIKNNGKIKNTDRSRRANHIRTCFTITKNSLAEAGEKEFFVQLIDPKNNLLGEPKAIQYEDATLNYSTATKVYYENEDLDVCVLIENDDLEDGMYIANIFYGPELVGSHSFKLK